MLQNYIHHMYNNSLLSYELDGPQHDSKCNKTLCLCMVHCVFCILSRLLSIVYCAESFVVYCYWIVIVSFCCMPFVLCAYCVQGVVSVITYHIIIDILSIMCVGYRNTDIHLKQHNFAAFSNERSVDPEVK